MLGDSFVTKIHLCLTYIEPPLKTVGNSDVGEKLLNLSHFKNVHQLSTLYGLIDFVLLRLETTTLSRILAWYLHLAAGCCKDSCSFC